MFGMTHIVRVPHGSDNRHTCDVDCDDILSCDCSFEEDSS